jgi:hypothetical protein
MEKVNPFTRTITLTWILVWVNLYYMIYRGEAFFDEVSLYYFTNTYQAIAIFYQIYYVQQEFLDILGIQMFKI